MKIKKYKIDELTLDPNNARKHGPKNLEAIKGSLAKFGQQKPVVVNSRGVVVAGNGTLEAARALGWTEINAVVTDLDDFNQTAFALADNRTAELAQWDDDILGSTLQALREEGFDIGEIGFDIADASFNYGLDDNDNPGGVGNKFILEANFDTEEKMLSVYHGLLKNDVLVRIKRG